MRFSQGMSFRAITEYISMDVMRSQIMAVVVVSFLANTCHGSCSLLDRNSLSSFNLSISVGLPLNWSLSADCCSWEGVGCNEFSRVTSLWLPSRGLSGSISPRLLNLTSLSNLNLSYNRLSGLLPDGFFAAFGLLQAVDLSWNLLSKGISASDKLPATVRTLNLSSNHLHGTILPSFLSSALNLEAFDVSNNRFFSSIPWSICFVSSSVQFLDFSDNDFTGPIPQELNHCSNLQSLRAGFNDLSGEVPPDVYGLLKLQELYLPSNRLSGWIDGRIANLINLKILALYGNELTGTIPQDIGQLSKLEQLLLHINQLTGTIPPSLANCTQLAALNLRVNSLEGELSAFDFSRLVQLKTVDLGDNLFAGALPVSLFSCKKLTAVRLASNNLSGEVLPEILALRSLSFLSLSNNSLTNIRNAIRILAGCKNLTILLLSKNFYGEEMSGSDALISSEEFQTLQVLSLGACGLTGTVPWWLLKLANLAVLDLSFNNITGPIPGWIGTLPSLFYLDLSNNQISGHFPVELTKLPRLTSEHTVDHSKRSYLELPVFVQPTNLSNLQYNRVNGLPMALYINNNSIDGAIPAEIGQLKFLIVLDLSNNNFSGSIPDNMSDLTALEKLDLSGNHLSGEIPMSLRKLSFLSYFSVAYNDLGGPIPTGGQFDTFLSSSFEGNPGLCGQILLRTCSRQGEARQGIQNDNETINWIGFEIGFAVSFIITLLAVLNLFF